MIFFSNLDTHEISLSPSDVKCMDEAGSQSPACLEKFQLTVFGYRPKNDNSELGIFFRILSF